MARLNDPPAPAAESIDALKRRFIRQNREIARVNSNQSIRIRNLETEISRLLAENIVLREQAIAATTEAEKWKSSHRLARDVVKMKEKLEAKMAEVNALVGELGQLPEKTARRSSVRRRKSGLVNDLIKSPVANDWRNRQTASGVDRDIQEIKMPAILEDKYYPRRTLDVDEINTMVQDSGQVDSLESPELGPPPIAHLEDLDTSGFESRRSGRRASREMSVESQDNSVVSGVNTDTRRKRRTSSLLQDMSGFADESQSILPEATSEPGKSENASKASFKPGAKRKLDVSELEDTSAIVSKEVDDFIFQKKASTTKPIVKSTRFAKPPVKQTKEDSVAPNALSPAKQPQQRKILAPKSTNSPAKRRVGATYEKGQIEKDEQPDTTKQGASKLRNRPPKISLPAPVENQPQTVDLRIDDEPLQASVQPKTPAAELADLLSPSSVPTEPSTRQRATQEVAITNSVEDVLNGSIGRGSRRARAAVSYAEPNLRDKMRRPGKELVGAVEGYHKSGEGRSKSFGVSFDTDSRRETMEVPSAIKANEEQQPMLTTEEETARALPNMNGSKQLKEEAPSPLRGKKAPLVRAITKTRHDETEFAEDDELNKAVSHLSVFDPPSSSPIAEEKNNSRVAENLNKPKERPASRTRRHSVQVQASNSAAGLQRPSSASAIRRDDLDKENKMPVRRSASVTNLPPASALISSRSSTASSSTRQSAAVRDPATTVMSRRRSMMI